jgi:MFS family permease
VAMLLVLLWVRDPQRDKASRAKERFKLLDRSLLSAGLVSAALATFFMGSAYSMVITLENEFNERPGMNALGFGIAFSSLMAGRLVSRLPAGRFADIIGRKPLVPGGLILMAPSAAIAAPAFAVAGGLSTEGGQGRQMSLVTIGFGLGIAMGPLLAGLRYMPETLSGKRVLFK